MPDLKTVYVAAPVAPLPGQSVFYCACPARWWDLVDAGGARTWTCPVCRHITVPDDRPEIIVKYNLINAKEWIGWMIRSRPDCAIVAPWIPYVEALDDFDPIDRARGQRDDDFIIENWADEVCLVAGRVSTGMRREAVTGWKHGSAVRDLTWLGRRPPPLPGPQYFDPNQNGFVLCPACFRSWHSLDHVRAESVCSTGRCLDGQERG